MHMVSARMLYNMVDVVVQKDDQQSASKLLSMLLKGCIDKIESMALVLKEVTAKMERANASKTDSKTEIKTDAKTDVKSENKADAKTSTGADNDEGDVVDISFIEKARPIASATYAVEKPEELIIGMSSKHWKQNLMPNGIMTQSIVHYSDIC
jgi:transformation/transcription domain-associated protein